MPTDPTPYGVRIADIPVPRDCLVMVSSRDEDTVSLRLTSTVTESRASTTIPRAALSTVEGWEEAIDALLADLTEPDPWTRASEAE